MLHYVTLKGRLVRRMLARRGAALVNMVGQRAHDDLALIRDTHSLAPLLVQDAAAFQILACARASRRLGGTMAEAGVFAGGTARLICEAKGDVPLRLFDVFETLQQETERAGSSDRSDDVRRHFGAVHTPRAAVERLLAPYAGVHLHAGLFPDSARGLEHERFSFVHVDLDLERSTGDALEFFHPRLLPGGVLLGDDYHDPGVRRAFDGYFAGRPDTVIALQWGQVMIVKASAPVGETPYVAVDGGAP
jgi:O-methyltransferase